MVADPALLSACRALDPEPIAELTLDLTRLWSPPGQETKMAERMAEEWQKVGARVRLDFAFPSSPSVIAEFGATEGPTLQWHGHLDAVELSHPEPARTGGLIVGRGAADMKGPLASMIAAAQLLRSFDLPGKVLVTLHGMHESGGNEPLHDLIARGIHGDAVITGELGGGLELPLSGLGLSFWEASIAGSEASVHEAFAGPGTIDPVEVGRILHSELATLRDHLAVLPGESPRPSLFIGQFAAGDYVNRISVRGQLKGTRRHDSSTTPDAVESELREIVSRVASSTGAAIELKVTPVADSFAVSPEEAIVRAMRAAHRDLMGQDIPITRTMIATNAVHFVREAGIPAVAYGPDPISNHSDYEYVSVEELARIGAGFAWGTARYFGMQSESDD